MFLAYYLCLQVYEAARHAAIHDSIMNFPEKYSTVVGERGLKVIKSSFILDNVFSIFFRFFVQGKDYGMANLESLEEAPTM